MIIINIVIITSLYTLLFFDIKKNSKFFNKPNLFFLNRFIIISILALLLLNFKFSFNFSNQVKDKISIFIDNSLSMNEQIKNNNQIIVKLIDFQNILDQKKIFYDIYSFDSDVNSIQDLEQIKFSENQTNFKNLLTYIKKIETKNNIIVSDGINTGSVIDNKLKDLKEMKVFSLGIGEDLFFEDISINDSYFVNLDFLSDSIMLVVDFNYSLNNNINKKIEFVFNDSSKSKYEKINLYSGTEIYGSKEFTLDKDDAKNLRYIKIDPVEFEKNISNNIFHIKYNSLFDFKNVLLISGQLNNNTSYIKKLINLFDIEILSHQYKIKSKWNKQYNLSNYDLIVFDKRKRVVKEVIEVKCSKDICSAASKSNAQLKRFKRYLKYKNNKLPKIYFKSCNNILQLQHFTKDTKFSKLTYNSVLAQDLGFELLSLGLSDMQYLTDKWNDNRLPNL